MSIESERAAVLEEAMSWRGTPYHPNADVKGSGVDCGMLLVRVYVDTGLRLGGGTVGHFPPPFDPRPYPNQWHLHNREERYLEIVRTWARELPEGTSPLPGDIAMFHYGHCYAHGGIVTEWPTVIHAMGPDRVMRQSTESNIMLKRLRKKFFTIWYDEP